MALPYHPPEEKAGLGKLYDYMRKACAAAEEWKAANAAVFSGGEPAPLTQEILLGLALAETTRSDIVDCALAAHRGEGTPWLS